jgi:O-antigen/teichoic acid export membrane protein
MSIAKRLITGSLASWFQIGVTIITQIVLVPVYLSSWNIQTYGLWIAVQALSTIMTSLDMGHHNFLNFEFLRIGKHNLKETSLYLWSGVWIGFGVGLLQIIIIVIILSTGLFKIVLSETSGIDKNLIHATGIVLLLQSVTWCIFISSGGIFVRALNAFDEYPRMAWWAAFATAVTSIAPAIAVYFGAGFLLTAIVLALTSALFYTIQYIDVFRLLRKYNIAFTTGSFKVGWQNFLLSIAISVKNLLENARNVGVRVVLAPLAGAASLVAFSTIRTGANFAMQGLHSVTYPMMPELMKFLHKRDQDRSEIALGTIWIIIIAIMAPAVVTLQTFIEPLFKLWTRGKVPFDPLLFSILSLSVLVYAIAQPAIAIVTGNNLLKIQLRLSALAAFIVVAGMIILVPKLGILGAGIVLLAAEIVAAIGYVRTAKIWLKDNGLVWPRNGSRIATRSVYIAAAGMGSIILFESERYLLLAATLVLMVLNIYDYWRTMPAFARFRTKEMIRGVSLKKY